MLATTEGTGAVPLPRRTVTNRTVSLNTVLSASVARNSAGAVDVWRAVNCHGAFGCNGGYCDGSGGGGGGGCHVDFDSFFMFGGQRFCDCLTCAAKTQKNCRVDLANAQISNKNLRSRTHFVSNPHPVTNLAWLILASSTARDWTHGRPIPSAATAAHPHTSRGNIPAPRPASLLLRGPPTSRVGVCEAWLLGCIYVCMDG